MYKCTIFQCLLNFAETTNSKQSYSQRHKAERWKVKEQERKSESQQREIQSVYQELTAISDKLRVSKQKCF